MTGRLHLRATYTEPGPLLHPRDHEELVEHVFEPEPEPEPEPAVGPMQGTYTIPETSLPKLMWMAYVQGASWTEGDYPAWDDKTYYEDTPHGQGMLADFIAFLDEARRPDEEPARRTMCAVGRPLRQHAKKCHPQCDFQEPR